MSLIVLIVMLLWKLPCNVRYKVNDLCCSIVLSILLSLVNKRPADDPRLDAAKIARVEDDDMQKLKDRREKKFDEKNKEIAADQIRPLSGELSKEAILKLRAKVRATARDKIVDFKENEDTPEPSTELLPITADTFEIMKQERTWRNRTTVLQSTNKVNDFLVPIFDIDFFCVGNVEFREGYFIDLKFHQSERRE